MEEEERREDTTKSVRQRQAHYLGGTWISAAPNRLAELPYCCIATYNGVGEVICQLRRWRQRPEVRPRRMSKL